MNEAKLKDCPFCGESARVIILSQKHGRKYWAAGCDTIGCRGRQNFGNPNLESEVADWNKRAVREPEANPNAEIKPVRFSAWLGGTESKALNRPNASGWWWRRPAPDCLWSIVDITVEDDGKIWIQEQGDEEPDLLLGCEWWEWVGPLPQPVPPNAQAQ